MSLFISFLITTCSDLDFETSVVRIIPSMKYPSKDPVFVNLWGGGITN
jgi:hypothetical protein